MTLHGIDISHWQSGLDVARSGAQFAIMKATEGTGYVDDHCDAFYQQAKAAGVLRGVYHFYRGNPTAEADFFVKNIGGYVGDALLALDFEDTAYSRDVAGAKAFLDRVTAKTGVKPVIYMNRSFLTGADWGPVVAADYGLWLARYSSETGSIAPWPALTLWQYTSSGHVNGYSGNVDLDYFYGDASTWAAYAGGSSVAPTPPDPGPAGLVVDGFWGNATTTRLQQLAGTTADGVVSSQAERDRHVDAGGLPSFEWVSNSAASGSDIIAWIQRQVGVRSDRFIGTNTVKAMQAHYGTTQDGVVSGPSDMVRAMQTALNEGRF